MPRSVYQRIRSSIQCSCQRSASSGGQKNSISICSNSRVRKMKLPVRDLVAKRLADLRDPERRLLARELEDVLEVDEDPLGGLGAQVGDRGRVLHRPDVGLEHEVELARVGELAVGALAGALRGLAAALRVLELVGAEAQLAGLAVDQRVGEPGQVARRLPDPRVLDDRRVDRDDVVALLEHRPPPLGLDVVLQQHAVVAVVVGRADPAVDLRRREDEAAPLAQRDDLVERRARRRSAVSVMGATCGGPVHLAAILARHADLRVPLHRRAHVRGLPVDVRRPGDRLRGLRQAGRARLPPGRRPLQGLGLLHHRLRQEGRRKASGDGDGKKESSSDSKSDSSSDSSPTPARSRRRSPRASRRTSAATGGPAWVRARAVAWQ